MIKIGYTIVYDDLDGSLKVCEFIKLRELEVWGNSLIEERVSYYKSWVSFDSSKESVRAVPIGIIDEAKWPRQYDPEYGDYNTCVCGHHYYRHFDTYDDMSPIGCKYCPCPGGFRQV